MEKFDFTAIDFETMTAEHTSACAIGIVRVENCVIKQKFYSLIKPIPDNRDTTNSHVHGITPDMVENAPTFLELWPLIKDFFEGQELVCHNAIFDITVLVDVCKYYGIELQYPTYTDTLEITCKGLKQSCIDANIPIHDHHDALADATACARLLLHFFGVMQFVPAPDIKEVIANRIVRDISSDTKKPLSDEEIVNKDTPFYKKKVVITGVLSAFPYREDLASLLKKYGADINSSISSKTNIVIVGEGAGPSKMKKIELFNSNSCIIKVLYEPDLMEILEKYDMK